MEETKKLPWYQRVRRWGQTNLTEDDPARHNIDFWRSQWKRTHIQGVIVNCGGIVAYYPSRFGLQYRAATLGEGDYFGEFAQAAREEGLAVIARMDINRATEDFFRAHPDWFCRDKEGNPIMSQGRYFSCVNSGYYKEYIPAVLTEIIQRYHPEGFADNSWKGLGRGQICYCENCRKAFREKTGLDLPDAPDWENPVYRAWIRWSYDCRTENWDLFNEVTQREGGEDCLWLGMLNGDPVNAGGSFGDLKALCSRSKVIFSDHQSRDGLNGFEQNHDNGMLLRLAAQEQVVVPESFANYVRGRRTFRLAANPWQETQMWMVSGVAGGISPWYHHIGGGEWDRRQFETPVPLFRWHAQHEPYLYDRVSLANVGLVWSQTNADFYGRDQARERVALPWRGFTLALHEGRIPFLPIHVDDIARYASRVRTLILPDVAAMTEEQEDSVCRYLEQGGNLILTGGTATLDEDGQPRSRRKLWDVLGLSETGRVYGAFTAQPSDWEHPQAHTYLHLPQERHPIWDGFSMTEILGFGGGLRETVSSGTLVPMGGFVKPFPIYPPEFSWIREIDDAVHPIFAGELPNGSRVVYFAADIDRCFGRDRLPDHGRLLENAIRWTLDGELPVRVEGDGFVDVSLYAQGERRILHLVNLSGCDVQPGYCHRLLPVYGLRVSLPWRTGQAHLRLLVSGGTYDLDAANGEVSFPIEKLVDHEVVVIE